MAETKKVDTKLSAASLREMKEAELQKLLATKRADLNEVQRSLKAGELANPRKIKELRREIALILTVENEPARGEKEENK